MKDFFKDYDGQSIIDINNVDNEKNITKAWNKDVPEHVNNFNNYTEDRQSVIYFALFLEFHINKTLEILFPDFDDFLSLSKTSTSMKINILASFRLFPNQVFEAARCINNIRNEFAHELLISNLEDFKNLKDEKKKKTIDKLNKLIDEYKGDYEYENIDNTIRSRFKSLVMNTITAFRIYEPMIINLREDINQFKT